MSIATLNVSYVGFTEKGHNKDYLPEDERRRAMHNEFGLRNSGELDVDLGEMTVNFHNNPPIDLCAISYSDKNGADLIVETVYGFYSYAYA